MLDTRTIDGLITKDARLHNGRPIIAGTGNTVRAVAIMYRQGHSPEDIAGELPLTLAQVYGALTYYHIHTEEIEADIQADSEEALKSAYAPVIDGPTTASVPR